MISDIRKNLKSPVYQSLMWVVALSMIGAYSIPSILRTLFAPSEPWALKVNGYEISTNELTREVHQKQQWLEQMRAMYGPYVDSLLAYMNMNSDPRILATETLIREEILSQLARSMGIALHEDYVRDALRQKEFLQDLAMLMPPTVFQADGHINRTALHEYLRAQRMNISAFDRKLERMLMRNFAIELLAVTCYTPTFDVAQEYLERYSAKTFSYISFSFDDFLKKEKKKEIAQNELAAFYTQQNQQKKRYWIPEKRGGTTWKFDPASYHIQTTDQELQNYYQDNKDRLFVRTPAQVQVRKIFIPFKTNDEKIVAYETVRRLREQVVENPAQFAAVAKAHSQDEATAKDGGLMPAFSKGQQEHRLEREAFSLQNDGDISAVFETDSGYAVVQRVSKTAREYEPFAHVAPQIKNDVRIQIFKKLFLQDMKEALAQGQKLNEALTTLAQNKSAQVETVTPRERDETKLVTTLFKLKKGETTYFIENGIGYAVQLTTIEERHLPALETIQAQVKDDMYELRARQALGDQLVQARAKIAQGAPLSEVARSFGAPQTTTGQLTGESKEAIASLEKKGLPVSRMLLMSKVGLLLVYQTDQAGFVIRLDAIDPADSSQFDQKKLEEVQKATMQERKGRFIEAFIASLYRNARIVSNERPSQLPDVNDYFL